MQGLELYPWWCLKMSLETTVFITLWKKITVCKKQFTFYGNFLSLEKISWKQHMYMGSEVDFTDFFLFFFEKMVRVNFNNFHTVQKKILENSVARISLTDNSSFDLTNFFTVYLKCVNDVDLTKFLLNDSELFRVIKFFS